MDISGLLDREPGGAAVVVDAFSAACAGAIAAVAGVRDAARGPGGPDGRDGRDGHNGVGVDAAVLAARAQIAGQLAREVDLLLAEVACAIERHGDTEPDGGVARRLGHRGTVDMIASILGSTRTHAGRLLDVGRVLTHEPAPDGEPGHHPHVAEALNSRELSVDCASTITSMLDALPKTIPTEHLRSAERDLVSRAPGLTATTFGRIVTHFRTALTVDTTPATLERLRANRYLHVWEDRDGMLAIDARLDPETAAPVRAALDALVSDAMRRARDSVATDTTASDTSADTGTAATRTATQMRADALADLARHALACTATDLPLASTTVVIRVHETDLHTGMGNAEIDGTSHAIDISTARRMAANAHVIPAVMGSHSELLDWGRKRRLFTTAQRLALIERDGGCAFCGAPPGWAEVHHIEWWSRDLGITSIANGVLLCRHCHHTIHHQGWTIHATTTEVWFTPPASIDPRQTPRQGGRARFHAPRSLSMRRAAEGTGPDSPLVMGIVP
jgi:hypothetical protein